MASSLVNVNTMYSRRLCRPCRCCTWRSDFVMVIPAEAVRQWVVVFPMRLRYFLNIDAGCLNRAAGIAMREVPRRLSTPFWMGRPLGRAGDGETQRRTLLAALELLVTI